MSRTDLRQRVQRLSTGISTCVAAKRRALTLWRSWLGRQHGFIGRRLESSELLHRFVEGFLGFAKLYHADLEIAERALYKAISLLVVGQQVMPQWVLQDHISFTSRIC